MDPSCQKLAIPSSWCCLQRAKVRWWQVIFPPFPGPAANSPIATIPLSLKCK